MTFDDLDVKLRVYETAHDYCVVPGLYITWELVEELRNEKIENISERKSWNAEIAYKWLVDELIPKAFGHNKNFLKSRNIDIDEILQNNSLEYISYLKSKQVNTIEDIREVAEHLQNFYHCHPQNKYRINKIDFEGIYNSILICLNNSEKVDSHYICEKLSISGCNTIIELIMSIEADIMEIKDKTVIGFDIDYLFRALMAALDGKKINLTIDEIKIIMKNIEYFILLYDRDILLEKYAVL